MKSSRTLPNASKKAYETKIGYLQYDDESDMLSIPIQIRERHLTPDTKVAFLQGIGTHLQIAIWSTREDIVIRVPFSEWRTTKSYQGKLTGENQALLTIGRYEDYLTPEDEGDGRLEIAAHVQEVRI